MRISLYVSCLDVDVPDYPALWGMWKYLWDESPPTFICSASFSCWPAAFHDISNIMSETVVRVIPERLVRQELKVTGSEDKPPDPGNVSCMFCPFRATLREPTTAHTSAWAPAKNLSSLPLPHVMTWHPDWMGVMLVDTSKARCRCGSSGSFLLSFMVVMWYTSKREPALFASSLPPGNKDQWNCKATGSSWTPSWISVVRFPQESSSTIQRCREMMQRFRCFFMKSPMLSHSPTNKTQSPPYNVPNHTGPCWQNSLNHQLLFIFIRQVKEPLQSTPSIPQKCSIWTTSKRHLNISSTVTKHLKLTPGSWNKQDVANYFVCVGTIGQLSLRLHSGQLLGLF